MHTQEEWQLHCVVQQDAVHNAGCGLSQEL